jgi:basic amino acid/polyamine antiporter, APA family
MNLFRKKNLSSSIAQFENKGTALKKDLGAFDLMMLGIECIIGTGIFVLTGVAAAEHASPALVISFILSSLAYVFAALCYSEFVSGAPNYVNAYKYSYSGCGVNPPAS